jgi:predicted ATPase
MKIDIHVHTKKTKQGDAETRAVDADKFHQIVSSTEVEIIAITNHNVFDLEQYQEFTNTVGDDFQIWPGIELDVVVEDRRGHLLVIVSPEKAKELAATIASVSAEMTPDNFKISLDEVISNFDQLNPIYIAHYKQKKPDLNDDDIECLIKNTAYKNRVLKEATNAVSAGIFISHGHASIYGSDVQNWDKYHLYSKKLPDLRLPVESFEQFCLLLEKDQVAIDTLLNQKRPEEINIKPFKDNTVISLNVFDDINVFFGAKGTGKSDILRAISKHYSNKGIACKSFESGSDKLGQAYDIDGKDLTIDLNDYKIEYCNKEIDLIRAASEANITSISRYLNYFDRSLKNKKAQKIKIKDLAKASPQNHERRFNAFITTDEKVIEFIEFVEESSELSEVLKDEELETLLTILNSASERLGSKSFDAFKKSRTVSLFNSIIEKFKTEIARKTHTHAKPSETGFRAYASNRIQIELAAKKIVKNISKPIIIGDEYVGNLDDKGQLYCKTDIRFQDGDIHDGDFKQLRKVNKKSQKKFSKLIKSINQAAFSSDLFNNISELNEMDEIDTFRSILQLVVFDKYFTIDGCRYEPSTGEHSMILLHRELVEEKDIYILDEPEKSLGNEYINNIIVPLIKEKAGAGKKVFIATHDANIAVRTLPYNSIYRHHDLEGYKTYVGNPFSNNLVELTEENDIKDWKDVSMRTLEGGKDAFGERGQIYGNV